MKKILARSLFFVIISTTNRKEIQVYSIRNKYLHSSAETLVNPLTIQDMAGKNGANAILQFTSSYWYKTNDSPIKKTESTAHRSAESQITVGLSFFLWVAMSNQIILVYS